MKKLILLAVMCLVYHTLFADETTPTPKSDAHLSVSYTHLAQNEKRRLGVVLLQHRQNPLRDARRGAVVEGQENLDAKEFRIESSRHSPSKKCTAIR